MPACPVCGKADAACGGPSTHGPGLTITRRVETPIMSAQMIRVDRGDGKLFQYAEGDVKAFLAANPGAHVVPGRKGGTSETPAEVAATVVAKTTKRGAAAKAEEE